jgi:quinol monooxygenase YgiN
MSKRKPQAPSIDDLRAEVSTMLDRLDPGAPIAATVTFLVDPDKEDTFRRRAEVLTEATRPLPGNQVFVFHKREAIAGGDPDPPEYVIYEDWDSVKHFRRQWDSHHLKDFQYGVGELLADPARSPPDLRFFHGTRGGRRGGGRALVLKTGQTKCWDSEGEVVPCAGTGADGELHKGAAIPHPRFHDNQNGTVTDNLTGLIWLKDADAFGERAWADALAKANGLQNGDCGLSDDSNEGDWRLPNTLELLSLLDLSNTSGPPLPRGHPFRNVVGGNYWSSTTVAAATALGWYVAMAVGCHVFDLKGNRMHVWPVRGGDESRLPQTGQTKCYDPTDPRGLEIRCGGTGQDGELRKGMHFPEPRFHDNGDGTVSDRLSGLVWLKNANPFGRLNWEDALDECNSLRDGKHNLKDDSEQGAWRLPNINELLSLLDFDRYGPTLPDKHPFKGVRPTLYWSSTTVASAPTLARFLFIGLGSAVWDHKSIQMCVWPVRDEHGDRDRDDR